MTKKLSELSVGDSCTIVKVRGEGIIIRRLLEMGLTKGTKLYFRKQAPLGDPIEITLRGYELSLRKVEAECITVELLVDSKETNHE